MMSKIEAIKCANSEGFILAAAQHPRLHSCVLEENENITTLKNDIISALGSDDDIAIVPLGDNYFLAEVMYDTVKDLKIFKDAFQSVKEGLQGIATNFEDGILFSAETGTFNSIKSFGEQKVEYANNII